MHVVFGAVKIRIFDIDLGILDNYRISHVGIPTYIVVQKGILYQISPLLVGAPVVTMDWHVV